MITKKILLTIIIILSPMILLAQGQEMKGKMNFWQLLFQVKYIAAYLVSFAGILLIWSGKITTKTRLLLLSASFLLFGVISYFVHQLFLTPSPVCSVTKPFLYGLKNNYLASLIVILLLSAFVGKGFCGTACPVGALQELLYKIPWMKHLKRKWKVSFSVTNTIRAILFIIFLIFALSFGFSVYGYINLFDLIHWDFNMPAGELLGFILFLIFIIGASFFLFRPFCYFICPMGLVSWIFEQFAPLRIRINKDKCTSCSICEAETPCPSFRNLTQDKQLKADCHLCGSCINECVFDAVYFGLKK